MKKFICALAILSFIIVGSTTYSPSITPMSDKVDTK